MTNINCTTCGHAPRSHTMEKYRCNTLGCSCQQITHSERDELSALIWAHLTGDGWEGLLPAETQEIADVIIEAGWHRVHDLPEQLHALARDVLSLADDAGMPETYQATDARMLRARAALQGTSKSDDRERGESTIGSVETT
jgi:hypothetical protein